MHSEIPTIYFPPRRAHASSPAADIGRRACNAAYFYPWPTSPHREKGREREREREREPHYYYRYPARNREEGGARTKEENETVSSPSANERRRPLTRFRTLTLRDRSGELFFTTFIARLRLVRTARFL